MGQFSLRTDGLVGVSTTSVYSHGEPEQAAPVTRMPEAPLDSYQELVRSPSHSNNNTGIPNLEFRSQLSSSERPSLMNTKFIHTCNLGIPRILLRAHRKEIDLTARPPPRDRAM